MLEIPSRRRFRKVSKDILLNISRELSKGKVSNTIPLIHEFIRENVDAEIKVFTVKSTFLIEDFDWAKSKKLERTLDETFQKQHAIQVFSYPRPSQI